MKKQMKQVAAATLAALCLGAVAMPTVASAATITISSSSSTIALKNTTFNAYKVFGVTETKVDESTTITKIDGSTLSSDVIAVFNSFIINATDKVADTDSNEVKAAKIEKYLGTLEDNSDAMNALARALEGKLGDAVTEWKGDGPSADLDAGYYLVTGVTVDGEETVYSSVMLKSATENITINLKADKPTVEKKIVEDEGLVDANTAGVGETVNYQVSSKVPDHTYYANYEMKFTDTICDGLVIDVDTIVVKVGENTVLTKGTDYTVTTTTNADADDDVDSFVIELLNVKGLTVDDAITITYSATVDADAVIHGEGNPNKVKLTYSNDPNWDTDGDGVPDSEDPNPTTPSETPDPENPPTPPTETTPEDEVITYLTEIVINKVDELSVPMKDIEFTVTSTEGHIVQYTVKKNEENNTYTISETNLGNAELTSGITVTTNDKGEIVISGLTAATYTITEKATEANKDYILAQPLVVTIGAAFADQENSTAAPAWTYDDGVEGTDNTQNTFTIINKKGTTLPETGGLGTAIFTIVGLTLMGAGAGAFLIKRKVTAQ